MVRRRENAMRENRASNDPGCARRPTFGTRTLDYSRAPFLLIWEVTQACDLACVHCRADAIPRPSPGELTLQEARRVFAQARAMGTRLLVLTGGDPLKREDIFDLIRAARQAKLSPALSPSVTPLLTPAALRQGRDAGLHSVSLSLDGATSRSHDAFRCVPGAFERTRKMAGSVVSCGLELRINTTVTSTNLDELPAIADLVGEFGARVWSVFFLVPTGRAGRELQIDAAACEEVLRWIYNLSSGVPFRIKTTEAPQYRRVVLEAMAREAGAPLEQIVAQTRSGKGRYLPGINDGKGFVFISHLGDVYPSGFFPLAAGNVRRARLDEIYRESELFQQLRDPDRLQGRCGRCPFRELCGGSRARAFAATGDPFAEDPLCLYDARPAAA